MRVPRIRDAVRLAVFRPSERFEQLRHVRQQVPAGLELPERQLLVPGDRRTRLRWLLRE
jgi:hypothetical protein